MIFLKLALWLIAPLFNAWMDRKGAKRNYLIVNILRGMAVILHGSMFIYTYEGWGYYFLPVFLYEMTSFWLVFEIALNLWQKKPMLYYDTKEHDSGWTDKFFAWAGTGWHTAAKLAALVGMIAGILITYQRHS